jgi:hypothetical protein
MSKRAGRVCSLAFMRHEYGTGLPLAMMLWSVVLVWC